MNLGDRRKKLRLIEFFKKAWIFIFGYLFLFNILPFIRPKKVSKDYLEFSETRPPKSTGVDRARLIESVEDAFNIRYELIKNSQESLDLAYHLIGNGTSTDALLDQIYQAGERGVKVRILIDGKVGLFNRYTSEKLEFLNSHENIRVKVYNPVNIFRPLEIQGVLHDKFMIVDGQYLLLGGRNLGDKYFNPNGYDGIFSEDRDGLIWRTNFQDEASVLDEVTSYMDQLWNLECSKPTASLYSNEILSEIEKGSQKFNLLNKNYIKNDLDYYLESSLETRGVYLLFNPITNRKKEPWLGYELLQLGKESKESILIQTPYSTGNKYLIEGLCHMARDKEITMVTNSRASTPNLPAFSNYYSQRKKFVKTGTRIFEYQNRDSIHGKSLIFDSRLSAVGSFNMDDRSFYLSTETMLVVDSEEFAASLLEAIDFYKSRSLEVGKDNKYLENGQIAPLRVSLVKRFSIWFTSIFSRIFQFFI